MTSPWATTTWRSSANMSTCGGSAGTFSAAKCTTTGPIRGGMCTSIGPTAIGSTWRTARTWCRRKRRSSRSGARRRPRNSSTTRVLESATGSALLSALHQERRAARDERAADEPAEGELAQAGVDAVANEDAHEHQRQGNGRDDENVAVVFSDCPVACAA